MAKITLSTIKRFIEKNREQLHISCLSSFDGMIDCVSSCSDQAFRPAVAPNRAGKPFQPSPYSRDNTLGIAGAWFVFQSRDSFSEFQDRGFRGYRISNCCGSFVLAVPVESDKAAA